MRSTSARAGHGASSGAWSERLVSTESWGGEWPETLNTLVLSEKDGRTTLAVTILYPSKDAREAVLGTGMTNGATMSYDRLDKVLATS